MLTPTLLLDLPVTQTFEEWSDLGRKLCTSRRMLDWVIGDWLIAGSERHGEKALTQANTIFRADVDRFGPIVDTCRRFPEPQRHTALTFGHHLAVMAVKDDDKAQAILTQAETERMTVAAVKAHVRVSTDRQATMLPDDDPEDTAMRKMVHAWNLGSRVARQSFFELADEANMGVIEL